MKTTLSDYDKRLREVGTNPALPYLILDDSGTCLHMNDRLKKILNFRDEKFPISKSKLLEQWLFFNEEMAGPAIFDRVHSGVSEARKLLAQLGLKTFRIWTVDNIRPGEIAVVCELLRRGDLMEDKESRQHLFRVLAHEIRTSTQIFSSYIYMTKSYDAALATRMEEGVKRLERAVALLAELKAELELE